MGVAGSLLRALARLGRDKSTGYSAAVIRRIVS